MKYFAEKDTFLKLMFVRSFEILLNMYGFSWVCFSPDREAFLTNFGQYEIRQKQKYTNICIQKVNIRSLNWILYIFLIYVLLRPFYTMRDKIEIPSTSVWEP